MRNSSKLLKFAGRMAFIGGLLYASGLFSSSMAAIEGADGTDSSSIQPDLSLQDLFSLDVYGVSKKMERVNESPMAVSVTTRDQLQSWGVRNPFEMIGRLPGFSFYNSDEYGQNGVLTRGLYGVFRVGYSYELMPEIDWGQAMLSTNFIKNVEAARGPAGLTWGGSAQAGMVNLNIRDDLNGGLASAEIGNANRQVYEYMYGKKLSGLSGIEGDNVFIGYHYEDQNAIDRNNANGDPNYTWKENGFWNCQQLLGKIQIDGFKGIFLFEDPHRIYPNSAFLSHQNARIVDSTISITDGNGFGDAQRAIAFRLEYKLPIKAFDLSLYHNYYEKIWSAPGCFLGGNNNRFYGFNGEVRFFHDKLDINFGGDLYGMSKQTGDYSSKFAEDSLGINWGQDQQWQIGQMYEQTSNFFIQALYKITDKFSALVGARVDYLHRYGPKIRQPSFYIHNDTIDTVPGKDYMKALINGPRAALFYELTPNMLLKYAFNRTFRSPAMNETWGNANIKPETNMANELSLSFKLGNSLLGEAVAYDQRVGDVIVKDPNVFNTFKNSGGGITSDGLELNIKWVPAQNCMVYTNSAVCYSRTTNTNFVQSASDTMILIADDTSFSTRFQPLYSGISGFEYDIMNLAKVALDGRVYAGIPYLNKQNVDEKALVGFLDLTLTSHRFIKEHVEASLNFLNLLDNRFGPQKNGVPAFGEHAGNGPGTIPAEGFKMYGKINFYF
jgi:outer membrane receptor protein involved in Fe transport